MSDAAAGYARSHSATVAKWSVRNRRRNERPRRRPIWRGSVRRRHDAAVRSTSICRNGASRPSPVALLIASLHVQYCRNRRRRSSGGEGRDRRALRRRQELAGQAIGTDTCAIRTLDVDADAHRGVACVRRSPISATLPVCETLKSSRRRRRASSGRPRDPAHDRNVGGRRCAARDRERAQRRASRDPARARARRCRSARRARARPERASPRAARYPSARRSSSHHQSETSSATRASSRGSAPTVIDCPRDHCRRCSARPHLMRFVFSCCPGSRSSALRVIVGRPFFDWGYYILRWRRRLAADNLARSFPELSAEARAAILKQSYRNLCDLVAEIIWSYGASPEDLRERVTVDQSRSRARAHSRRASRSC